MGRAVGRGSPRKLGESHALSPSRRSRRLTVDRLAPYIPIAEASEVVPARLAKCGTSEAIPSRNGPSLEGDEVEPVEDDFRGAEQVNRGYRGPGDRDCALEDRGLVGGDEFGLAISPGWHRGCQDARA